MSCEFGQGPTLVLGTHDPEMAAIKRMCDLTGTSYVYATDRDKNRVSYGNTYSAAGMSNLEQIERLGGFIIPVECCIPELTDRYVSRYDHHRQGDPGHDGEPCQAWELSSFGQYTNDPRFAPLYSPFLRNKIAQLEQFDDNPPAAIQNLLPSCITKMAIEVLIEGIAADLNCSAKFIDNELAKSAGDFSRLPTMSEWSGKVYDARTEGTRAPVYNHSDRLLYLAHAYISGAGVITHCVDSEKPDADPKVTVNGADSQSVADFVTYAEGLKANGEAYNIYFNIRRGYGGFYVVEGSDYANRFSLNKAEQTHYNLQVV